MNASTGQAENPRLGFCSGSPRPSAPPAEAEAEARAAPSPGGRFCTEGKVLIHSHDTIAALKSFLIALNLFPIRSACLYLIHELRPLGF